MFTQYQVQSSVCYCLTTITTSRCFRISKSARKTVCNLPIEIVRKVYKLVFSLSPFTSVWISYISFVELRNIISCRKTHSVIIYSSRVFSAFIKADGIIIINFVIKQRSNIFRIISSSHSYSVLSQRLQKVYVLLNYPPMFQVHNM